MNSLAHTTPRITRAENDHVRSIPEGEWEATCRLISAGRTGAETTLERRSPNGSRTVLTRIPLRTLWLSRFGIEVELGRDAYRMFEIVRDPVSLYLVLAHDGPVVGMKIRGGDGTTLELHFPRDPRERVARPRRSTITHATQVTVSPALSDEQSAVVHRR